MLACSLQGESAWSTGLQVLGDEGCCAGQYPAQCPWLPWQAWKMSSAQTIGCCSAPCLPLLPGAVQREK